MKQDRGWDNFDNTGPYWNFSSPRVTEWFLNEVAAEIVREANVQVSRLFLTRSYTFHTLLISSYHFSILYIYFSLASEWDKSDEVVQHFVATKKRGRLLWWNGLSLLWRDCWKLQCRCSYWRRSAALADDSNRCSNHFKHFQTFSYSRGFVLTLNIGHTIGEYQRHTQDLLQLFAIAKLAKDVTSDSFRWPVFTASASCAEHGVCSGSEGGNRFAKFHTPLILPTNHYL